jgi:hypothetical protein
MRVRTLLGAICTMLLWCGSCGGPRLPTGVTNEFFWMPEKQRNARFEKYDFDAQYAIYLYGCQKIEPPEIELAWQLARQGAPIVQPLEAKLENANDDLTIRDILFVFTVMSDRHTYDVMADKRFFQLLLLKQGAIKDPALNIIAQDDLADIRRNSAKAGNQSQGCFGCGYKLVARNALVEAGPKFDGKPVSTYGTIRFDDGVPYLGDYEAPGPDAVCLQTLRQQVEVLRKLTSLGVGVWGIYHRTAREAHKNCQNGTIIVQSVEISFE